MTPPPLPPGMTVLERGWLSANNIVFAAPQGDAEGAAVVDTGYVSHSEQTLALIKETLADQSLSRILNTHLHSDHCGGNAALQQAYPQVQTWVAPGQAEAVRRWDETALGYAPTGQECSRFSITGILQPGTTVSLSGRDWQIHAAPGHDPNSILFFEPDSRILISADALWENGFGVVFPEIEGIAAFDEVASTLDVIEQLQPRLVIPGHGSLFTDVPTALATARNRLTAFVQAPQRHANYAAKVLLKYKLLEWQRIPLQALHAWIETTAYFSILHQSHFHSQTFENWRSDLIESLIHSGVAQWQQDSSGQASLINQ